MTAEDVVKNKFLWEPSIINAAQIVGNITAASCGVLAALGGLPNIITGTIGPVLAVGVGAILLIGGLMGAVTVVLGMWWLERVALLITGLGWVLMLPACVTYAYSGRGTSAIWLVIALILTAISDVFKRYRRIDWAYLDPMRKSRQES